MPNRAYGSDLDNLPLGVVAVRAHSELEGCAVGLGTLVQELCELGPSAQANEQNSNGLGVESPCMPNARDPRLPTDMIDDIVGSEAGGLSIFNKPST